MDQFINENIDPKLAEFYDKHYTVLNGDLLNDKKYTYLGNKETKVCRFCGKDEFNGATFKKLAQALAIDALQRIMNVINAMKNSEKL